MKTLVTDADMNKTVPTLTYITPDMAVEWLQTANTENRRIRSAWVDTLAREITEGRWMMTGDPIRFDERGILIDGQHRLSAIARTQIAVPLYVIRGLPTGIRDVIDTGTPRHAGDTLVFAGHGKNAKLIAAVSKVAVGRERGYLRTARDSRSFKVTNSAVLEFVESHPTLPPIVHETRNNARLAGARSETAWVYSMWVLDQIDHNKRVQYETSLIEAHTDGAGDPRLALLRFFSNSDANVKAQAIPLTIYGLFRVWNAWRNGEKLSKLQPTSRGAGAAGNEIPEPVI